MNMSVKNEWLGLRKKLLFDVEPRDFEKNCESVLKEYADEIARAGKERRDQIAEVLSEAAVDMQSYLTHWHIQKGGSKKNVSDECIWKQADRIYNILEKAGYKGKADAAKTESARVKNSNLNDVSCKTDEGKLNNRIGNDAYYGLTDSMRRGCALVTTNPTMVNAACRDAGEIYKPVRDRLKKENPDATPDELVTLITTEVVYENCFELFPVFQATGGECGYVSLQVNPHNANDDEAMFKEVSYIYNEIEKRLGGRPNVVFKIPATGPGMATIRMMTKKGIGVTVTASCSVSQHLSAAIAIEEGDARVSFITMMCGRLDDRIAEELQALGVGNADLIAREASALVLARSYDIIYKKLGFKKSRLLSAAMRGPWNVTSSLANGPSCIFISLFPPRSEEYDAVPRDNVSTMGEKPDDEIMDVLNKSRIFRQAYEPEAMQPEDYFNFFPVAVAMKSFRDSYDDTVLFMTEE